MPWSGGPRPATLRSLGRVPRPGSSPAARKDSAMRDIQTTVTMREHSTRQDRLRLAPECRPWTPAATSSTSRISAPCRRSTDSLSGIGSPSSARASTSPTPSSTRPFLRTRSVSAPATPSSWSTRPTGSGAAPSSTRTSSPGCSSASTSAPPDPVPQRDGTTRYGCGHGETRTPGGGKVRAWLSRLRAPTRSEHYYAAMMLSVRACFSSSPRRKLAWSLTPMGQCASTLRCPTVAHSATTRRASAKVFPLTLTPA